MVDTPPVRQLLAFSNFIATHPDRYLFLATLYSLWLLGDSTFYKPGLIFWPG